MAVVDSVPAESAGFLPPETLLGRTAIVTGGGSGMGFAMARGFAEAGANVVLVGRSIDRVRASAALLGDCAIGVAADVRNPADIAAAFNTAEINFGPVTILGNNAGGNYPVLADAMRPSQWRSITGIAVHGTYICSAEFVRRRIAAIGGGVIVNNGAQYFWTGFPGDAHSGSAKAAVAGMSAAAARLWAPHGIRVNYLAAGIFPHDRIEGYDDPARLAELGAMVPAGRVGQMREFGWGSAFLASDYARALNGTVMMMDGGESSRLRLFNQPFVAPRDRESIW